MPLADEDTPYLSDAARRIREEVAALVPLMRRTGTDAERMGRLTPEVRHALTDAGVYRLVLPVEYGGLAAGARDVVEVVMELGRGDASAGWSAFVAGAYRMVATFPPALVDEIFSQAESWVGPLVANGAPSTPPSAWAERVAGGWLVEGLWSFTSGCRDAAWLIGGVVGLTGARPLPGMVVVPREEVDVLDDWHVMGLAASGSNSVRIPPRTFVPEHRFVDMAQAGPRMATVAQRFTGPAFQTGVRGGMLTVTMTQVAIAAGMARGALECFVEQAGQAAPLGLPYPCFAAMPSVQVVAGRARAMVNAARAVLLARADEVDHRTRTRQDFTSVEELVISTDLVSAARLAADAIDLLHVTLGSAALHRDNPVQRFARDARVLISHGALRLDPWAEASGRQLLGAD